MSRRAALVMGLTPMLACHPAPPPRDPPLLDDVAFRDARSAPKDGPEKAAPRQVRPMRWHTDLDAGRRRSRKEGRPLLVWVRADWSVEARLVEADGLSGTDRGDLFERLVLVKLDVTRATDAGDSLLARLGVHGVPAALFFDQSGREVARLESPIDTHQLEILVEKIADER